MIVGTGIDVVDVSRIAAFQRRHEHAGLRRIFAETELEYCLGRASAVESLAARFAAKEAFFKALGTGFGRGGRWTEVEVRRDEHGAPSLQLHGRAAAAARERGVERVHLSISHSAGIATAVVVLEARNGTAAP